MIKLLRPIFILTFVVISVASIQSSYAQGKYEILPRDPKGSPVSKSCGSVCNCTCQKPIESNHIKIRAHVTDEFIKHRDWMIDEFFTKHILPAMMLMTSQLSNVAIQQVNMVGTFFDAKHQLETQRMMQQMMAEAHKDYQPSEGLCEIGTNVRSLASSARLSDLTHIAFANRVTDRQLRNGDVISSGEENADIMSRLEMFKKKHCNIKDNSVGLKLLCTTSGPKEQVNKDVNFTKTLGNKLTLDIDLINGGTPTPDLENVFALTSNLFAHTVLPAIPKEILATKDGKPREEAHRYMDLRSIAAKRSIAQNSISAMIAEKTKGDKEVAPFLKKLVTELGVKDEDVELLLGVEPSYFAQMEVLTKDIYQNPVFFTELYDKPANVMRKGATIRALNLMQERDIFESQLRTEAVLAVMLETMLADEHTRVSAALSDLEAGGIKKE